MSTAAFQRAPVARISVPNLGVADTADEQSPEGIAAITIDRPEVRDASLPRESCRATVPHAPTVSRFPHAACDADVDGRAGSHELARGATSLCHRTAEGRERAEAIVEKRKPALQRVERFA